MPAIPEGSGESLLEKRIDAAFEKTAQPQKTRPFGHVEESFDGNVDGHPGEVAEGPAVGRHDGRNAGGKFRGTRPCAERIKSDARFGKGGMEFERSGTTRDLGRLPDGLTSLRVRDFIRNHAPLIRLFIHSVACTEREVKGKISGNVLL